jgi:death on curing protein
MTSLPESIYFLSVEEVKEIHKNQIDIYGGSYGIRDEGLLASAVAQPPSAFGEQYLHKSLPAMAAAYLFHLVMNHPFVDGNKRAGLAAALVFLELNGLELDPNLDVLKPHSKTLLEEIVISVTAKSLSKGDLTKFIESHTSPLQP